MNINIAKAHFSAGMSVQIYNARTRGWERGVIKGVRQDDKGNTIVNVESERGEQLFAPPNYIVIIQKGER